MKNKGFATIAILGIILGVLAVGGGAYYLGVKNDIEDKGIKENTFTNEKEKVELNSEKEKVELNSEKEKVELNSETADVKESSVEVFKNQPGEIKSIKSDSTTISVDLLSRNSKWVPGGKEDFFINENTKIRNLNITNTTKSYVCGSGPDKNETSPDILVKTSDFVKELKAGSVRYFDINGTDIIAMYEQCLP